jgi:hypothetical protein
MTVKSVPGRASSIRNIGWNCCEQLRNHRTGDAAALGSPQTEDYDRAHDFEALGGAFIAPRTARRARLGSASASAG